MLRIVQISATATITTPTTGDAALILESPSAPDDYGLTLTFHDSTGTDPAYGILKIHRPVGQYQWMFSTNDAGDPDRSAMRLGDNHYLALYDPAFPTDLTHAIELRPGSGMDRGVYWNNQRLATAAEISTNYVPLVNGGINVGGSVTIGTTTTPADLTVNGTTSTTSLSFPATTTSTAGVIYQDGERFLHSYGTDNVFLGHDAGNFGQFSSGTIGNSNIGMGSGALSNLTSGAGNVAIGFDALLSNRDGYTNIAIGAGALSSSVSNIFNIGIGHGAGGSLVGDSNSLIGYHAGANLTDAYGNTAVGASSLAAQNAGTGAFNTTVGVTTLLVATSASCNTVVGSRAALNVTSGSYNTLVGWQAGFSLTTGSGNILIGNNVDLADPAASNILSIGNLIYGTAVDGNGTTPSTGKIGIGTATPATKLDVAGDATVRGVLHVAPGGDISMGDFTAGTNPLPPQP